MDRSFEDDDRGAVEVLDGATSRPKPKASPALEMARAAAARAAAAESAGEPARKSRAWGRDAMLTLRRTHLYSGLLLYPWVLLYGVTAFLFNHPMAFPDQTVIRFGPDAMKGTALEGLPTAAEAATRVVAALNARAEGGAGYVLSSPEAARFDRGGVTASVRAGDGKSYSLMLGADGGMLREVAASAAPGGRGGGGGGRGGPGSGASEGGQSEAPFATTGVKVAGLEPAGIRDALPAVLAGIGLESPVVSDVRIAPLTFRMEGAGKPWLVTHDARDGAVAGRSVEDPASQADLTMRRFLLRLHLIHGYPSEFGQRWIWAFLVDVTAFLMVFWAVSGIVMWWQIKRTRRIGAAALVLSTASAVWIGVGLHGFFIDGGR